MITHKSLIARWIDAQANLQEATVRLPELREARPARRGKMSAALSAASDAEFRSRQSLCGKAKAEKERREDEKILTQLMPEVQYILEKNPRLSNNRVAILIFDRFGPKKRNKAISVSSLRQKFIPEARKRIRQGAGTLSTL